MLLGMLGTLEVVIILVVIMLIFGPSKLPQLGEGIGKMLRGFRKEIQQIESDKRDEAAPVTGNARDESTLALASVAAQGRY